MVPAHQRTGSGHPARRLLASAGGAAAVTAFTAVPLLQSPVVAPALALLLAAATGALAGIAACALLRGVTAARGRPLPLPLALLAGSGLIPLALLVAGSPLPAGWLASGWRAYALAGLAVAAGGGAWWARPGRRIGPTALMGGATLLTLAAFALPRPDVAGEVHLLPGALWAAALLAACTGWGELVRRPLALPPLDWGLRGALGAAAAVVGGGLLDACWAISRPLLLAAVALGVAAAGAAALERRPLLCARLALAGARRRPLAAAAAAALLVLAGLHLAGAVAGTVDTVYETPAFDLHDDEQAYLLMPLKMLQLGSLGPEPFEARRMLSLGGQPLLQALVLTMQPLRALHLLDGGVMLLLLVGLVTGGARRLRLHPGATVLLVLLVLALPHPAMRGNTSAVLSGSVLLLALYRLLADAPLPRRRPLAAALPLALLAAAACSVKSTFIPPVAALLGAALLLALATRRPRPWRETTLAAALAAAACWPWMVSLYGSSATFLYPVLGRGLYGGVFTADFAALVGDVPAAAGAVLPALGRRFVELLPLALLLPALGRGRSGAAAVAMAVGVAASSLALVLLGDPELNRSLARYAFPVATAGLAALALATLPRRRDPRPPLRRALALAVVAVSLLAALPAAGATWSRLARQARAAAAGARLVEPADVAAAALLQAQVPPGRAILATLRRPYLLDPARNPVLQMSLPGMSSLPPGLPLLADAAAVARYLANGQIDYLAYGGVADQQELLRLTAEQIRSRYPSSHTRWVMLRGHAAWRERVRELALTRTRRYDDGRRLLLQLDAPAVTVVPAEHPHTGFNPAGWTTPTGIVELPGLAVPEDAALLLLHTRGWHPWRRQPDRVAARVAVDGIELERAGASPEGFAFRWPPGLRALHRLRIAAPPLDAAAAGARPGQELGVDVAFVEVVARLEGHTDGIAQPLQPLELPLAPGAVWRRSGFFADNGWTDGHGVLAGLAVPVTPGHERLLVTLHPIHPWRTRPLQLGLRVLLNGVELEPLGAQGDRFWFRIAAGQSVIERIDLLSPTFVPAEVTGGDDHRALGVPLLAITTG